MNKYHRSTSIHQSLAFASWRGIAAIAPRKIASFGGRVFDFFTAATALAATLAPVTVTR